MEVSLWYMSCDHKVKDYAKWKPLLISMVRQEKNSALKVGALSCLWKTESHLYLLEFDSMNNAKKYYGSEDLKNVIKDAGVID